MVAWTDAEALAATLATGEVHFHSRSRGRLWRKGETSGNVAPPRRPRARLRRRRAPRDRRARSGPTCHRGERSCFDADGTGAPVGRPRGRASAEPATGPGLRLARDALGDDRRAGGDAPRGLVHRAAPRRRRRRGRPARSPRRRPRSLMAAKDDAAAEAAGARPGRDPRRARRRGRRPRCTTRSCCSRSAACRRRAVLARAARAPRRLSGAGRGSPRPGTSPTAARGGRGSAPRTSRAAASACRSRGRRRRRPARRRPPGGRR